MLAAHLTVLAHGPGQNPGGAQAIHAGASHSHAGSDEIRLGGEGFQHQTGARRMTLFGQARSGVGGSQARLGQIVPTDGRLQPRTRLDNLRLDQAPQLSELKNGLSLVCPGALGLARHAQGQVPGQTHSVDR